MASKEIFPPIVETYMPAFLISDRECRIYFSLSSYNTEEDILKKVQISVRNQNTNKTELNPNKATGGYPMGIKIEEYLYDNDKNMYYVTVKDQDLKDLSFRNNTYYKVQLRFISAVKVASGNVPTNPTSDWLNNNLDAFSEWSTVCLIKGISNPTLKINIFPPADVEEDLSDSHISLGTQLGTITGRLTFNDTTESETLKSYQIKVYEVDEATSALNLIIDSGLQYPIQTNEINYTIKKILNEDTLYKVYIELITKNLFSWTPYYTFNINTQYGEPFDEATLSVEEDGENGRVALKIYFNEDFSDNLVIRRASSETQFSEWEDISIKNLDLKSGFTYIWYDYTITSGIWYKYAIQKGTSLGERSVAIISSPVMTIFSDIFLNSDNIQLRIKYNPSVDSFKSNIMESKTDTIGSKYPFFNRNGVVNYKSFSIGGLISVLNEIETSIILDEEQKKLVDIDQARFFSSKDKLFGKEINQLYEEYNKEHGITYYNDYIYERAFREEVMNFLQNNNVKLFRSTPEGNLLVKIMDVSFSPEQSLGRQVYNFSATAYEVADCTIENYNKYNIQQIGDFLPTKAEGTKTYTYNILGQIQQEDSSSNVINAIMDKLKAQTLDKVLIKGYSYLKIEFQEAPYYIENTSKGPILSEYGRQGAYLGYIITLNQKNVAVNEYGIYELRRDDDLYQITSLTCQGECLIDYILKAEVQEENSNYTSIHSINNTSKNKNTLYTQKISQISGIFKYNSDLSKYLKGQNLTQLSISADENTCWEIQIENKNQQYILGKTEFLSLEGIIKSIKAKGIAIWADSYDSKKIKIEDNQLYYFYKNNWLIAIPYQYKENDIPEVLPIENYKESHFIELEIDTEGIIDYTYEEEVSY